MSPEANKVGQDTLEIQGQLEEAEEKLVSSITDWVSAAGKKITNPEFAGFLLDGGCVHLVAEAGGDRKLFAFGGKDWDENPGLYEINRARRIKLPFFSLTQIFDLPLDYIDWGGEEGKKYYSPGESFRIKTLGILKRKEVLVMGGGGDLLLFVDSHLFDDSQKAKGTIIKKRLNALIPDKQIYPLLLDGLYRAAGKDK